MKSPLTRAWLSTQNNAAQNHAYLYIQKWLELQSVPFPQEILVPHVKTEKEPAAESFVFSLLAQKPLEFKLQVYFRISRLSSRQSSPFRLRYPGSKGVTG